MDWTLRALLDAAGIAADTTGDAVVAGLAYDPSSVRPGDLFCCIAGARADGHDLAPAAVDAGSTALLVERPVEAPVPQARVARVRAALGPLAATFHGRPSEAMAVAGVTGTNGKTTVTYLVESIVRAAGRRPGLIGNVERRGPGISERSVRNTPEAVDLQSLLARLRDAGAEIVAMEVTSDGLEQGRVAGTRFATAAFTNLTADHLDTHGSMDAYFEAKASLFDPSYTARAVINAGDAWGARLVGRAGSLDVLTFGTADADVVATDVRTGARGTAATLRTPAGPVAVRSALVAPHNVENIACAAGIALHLGLPVDAIERGIADLPGIPGRLEPVDAGQPFLVLVDYAHTPDALERVLRAVRTFTDGRLTVVFGCGGDRDRGKRPMMGEAATRLADLSVLTSDNPRSEVPSAIIDEIEAGAVRGGGRYLVEADRRAAIAAALAEAHEGDVVLIAGKGHETGQTFADRTVPFDDRVVARELLEETRCRS